MPGFLQSFLVPTSLGIGFPNKKAQKKSELALLEWGPGSLKAFTIKTLQNAEFFVFFVLLLLEAVTRGTKNSTKGALEKHDLEHEGGARKARSGARFGARRGRSKSTIWSTIWSTKGALKKHDLEHDLEHEGGARKARFGARFGAQRGRSKSTIWSTKGARKARLGARFGARKHALEQEDLKKPFPRILRFQRCNIWCFAWCFF